MAVASISWGIGRAMGADDHLPVLCRLFRNGVDRPTFLLFLFLALCVLALGVGKNKSNNI